MIRPLTTADLENFIALRKQSWVTDPLSWDHDPDATVDPDLWRERIDEIPGQRVILGYFAETGQLLGSIGLSRFEKLKRRHRAMVWGVYVAPEGRGQGVSSKLLAECIAYARWMEGLHHLVLSLSHHAAAAHHLYTKAGFVEWGREPAAARTGETDMDEIHLLMVL